MYMWLLCIPLISLASMVTHVTVDLNLIVCYFKQGVCVIKTVVN
jgi:hypothetical protein